MTREEWLSQQPSYPSAPPGCVSLNCWSLQPGWVGGKLGFESATEADQGSFFLHTLQCQPLRFTWKIASGCKASEVFCYGDHVAVKLSRAPDGWRAEELILLAPAAQTKAVRYHNEWPEFKSFIRSFFNQRSFFEVETPSLTDCPGLEPTLEPFLVDEKFLPTSPEIHLKKALCLGFSEIFEIKNCFRKGENSDHHQPEFTMLEWYRAYADLESIIHDLKELLTALGAAEPIVTTFRELFSEHLQFCLTPQTSYSDLAELCQSLGLKFRNDENETDLFHRLWLEIEPHLRAPVIVRDFPPKQAALARIKTDGWADRFEFFWNGLEIANAFHEVNDPQEQIQRWKLEQEERRRVGTRALEGDKDLVQLMQTMGMPPAGGIALGLERLFMAKHGISDIRELRVFPY